MFDLHADLASCHKCTFRNTSIALFKVKPFFKYPTRQHPTGHEPRHIHARWRYPDEYRHLQAEQRFGQRAYLGSTLSTNPKPIFVLAGSAILRSAPVQTSTIIWQEQQSRSVDSGTLIVIERHTYYEIIAGTKGATIIELFNDPDDIDIVDVVPLTNLEAP